MEKIEKIGLTGKEKIKRNKKKEENGTVLFILKIRGNYEDKRK